MTWGLQQRGKARPAVVAAATSAASSPASAASAAAPAASAASAASQPASAAGSAEPTPEPLRLADWTPRDGDAWAALANAWGLPLPDQADPCSAAAQRGLQCYRSTAGSLSLIRLIDRPVLLTLQRPGQPPALAALVGLDGQQATLVVDGKPRRIAVQELAGAWRGEFTTFWRVPPGYLNRAENSGPLRDWLAAQLARINDAPFGAASAASAVRPSLAELTRQVQVFQASQGLQPDGRIGPITLMQINRAAGVAEPHLAPRSND
jgi:general secretion pathway protein A